MYYVGNVIIRTAFSTRHTKAIVWNSKYMSEWLCSHSLNAVKILKCTELPQADLKHFELEIGHSRSLKSNVIIILDSPYMISY